MWNGKDDVFEAYAGLRIYGQGLSPADISERLTLQPSHTDIRKGRGMWVYSTKQSLDCLLPLEQHILRIVEVLRPRADIRRVKTCRFVRAALAAVC